MYEPEVNDYVIWETDDVTHKGWVYFKCDEYITIEIGTKPRPQCDLSTFLHKQIHICLLCYKHAYKELQYVSTRPSIHDGLENSKSRFHEGV